MNSTRFFFSLGTGLAVIGLSATLLPTRVFSQSPNPRSRPAARAKPSPVPAATPVPTPPDLTSRPASESPDNTPPTDDDPAMVGQTETDIDATTSASFNSKDRIAVFTGNVRVKDPRFELACDELTVYLNKGAAPDAAAPGAAATPPPLKPAPAADPGQAPTPAPPGGGIDHAVAKGHVIIIQRKAATKPGEEDKLSIGRGGLGTFDNKTGDMVLKDWPNLEQNGSSLVAKAQNTVMTIHRDSSMNTDGPSITKLVQKHNSGAGGPAGGGIFDFGPANSKPRGGTPSPAPTGTPPRSPQTSGTQH